MNGAADPSVIREIDQLVYRSLEAFLLDASSTGWYGREREAVSLYAFGYLQRLCRPGSVLQSPTQICIEGAVKQVQKDGGKLLTNKDLLIWPKPAMNCWESRLPCWHPLAILEWKVRARGVSQSDVDWLCKFSQERPGFVGFALNMVVSPGSYKLSCTRVHLGAAEPHWMELEPGV
jgi:hypothetical protein